MQNVGTKFPSFGNNDDVGKGDDKDVDDDMGVYLNFTVSEANKIC